jgi:hypothetical protein
MVNNNKAMFNNNNKIIIPTKMIDITHRCSTLLPNGHDITPTLVTIEVYPSSRKCRRLMPLSAVGSNDRSLSQRPPLPQQHQLGERTMGLTFIPRHHALQVESSRHRARLRMLLRY